MLPLFFRTSSQLPTKFFPIISISHLLFSSQSFSPPAPRKGRQSVRRILKLLSSSSSQSSQNPNLSQTLKTLETSPQSLSSFQASTLITAISNPLISFDFYRFLKSMRPVFKPDSVLYASLIKSQLNSINPKLYKVQFYFNEMKKQRVCLSGEDFRSLFGFVIPNWVEIAEFLVRDGLEKIEFDEGSYFYVISCYVKHGFCKHAILVAERARIRSVKPNLEFYSCVMSVYRLSGDARAAVEMFLEMKERGVVANEGIYKILLEILCGVKWMKLCCVILEEMRVVGYKVDERLAVDLMRIFVEVEMVAEAGCFIKEGVLIGNESLGVFVEGMVEKGNPLVAIEMIKSIKESGLNVDASVYAPLIYGYGNMGLVEDAEKTFVEIKSVENIKNR